ncbi:MAG TPA: hypothetical protein VFC25_06255 [Verrucomicrobiae bacterium]|nr:hypothetical protein [Verrucomicrobiae bacterium]
MRRDDRVPPALWTEPGVRFSYVKAYAAIRRRCGFDPAAENYLMSWPSTETIAAEAGLDRITVVKSIRWLDDHDFIFHQVRPNKTSVYVVIDDRERFRATRHATSKANAIEELVAFREAQADESRSAHAAAAHLRRRKRVATSAAGPVLQATGLLPGGQPPGSRQDNHPVAGRTDRSVDQGSVDQGTESQGSVARPGPSRLSAVPRLNESDDQAGVAVFRVLREMAAQSRMPSTGMSEREQEARIAELRSQAAAMNSR